MGSRTTQRVVCPSCGELLRPTPELLLGLDGIACKCGFAAADRLPGAQHPKPGPTRMGGIVFLGAGGLSLLAALGLGVGMGLAADPIPTWAVALVGFLALDGAVCVALACHHWNRAGRYADCAHLLGDMIIRRTLVDGVRRIYRESGASAARDATAWLKGQGISSPEFRRDLMRDARGAARA